jgi:hypothetical protein
VEPVTAEHQIVIDAVVVASGDLWVVNPVQRSAQRLLPASETALQVRDPDGWISIDKASPLPASGRAGIVWHTRRLSWDGFDQLNIVHGQVTGVSWSPLDDEWRPFRVDLSTGQSTGSDYFDEDTEGWEQLAE